MSTTARRVIEFGHASGQIASLDADVEWRARREPRATSSGQAPPQQSPPPAQLRVFAEGREAHLEGETSTQPRVRAAALQTFGAHLMSQENLARRMRTNPGRTLSEIGYLTDAEKRLLATVDRHATGNLAEISEKYKKAAVGTKALAGMPNGVRGPSDYFSGFDLSGRGAPMGWGGISPPPGRGITVGGVKRPGRSGPWLGGSGGEGGGPDWASGGHGGRSPSGIGRDFSGIGIDLKSPRGSSYGPWPNQPGAPRGSDKWAATEGLYVPPQSDPDVGKAWDGMQEKKAGEERQLNEKTRAQETLEREAAEQAYLDEILSPEATGNEKKPGVVRASVIQPREPPPPPPKPDGSNPNPEGTGGPGPIGPWSRGEARGRYGSLGREAVPNPEGTGGPGPIGPWSRAGSRGRYSSLGGEATPNPEGTGGPGPIGPWSRTRSRAAYGRYAREAMPDPDADPGRGGPVGPAT